MDLPGIKAFTISLGKPMNTLKTLNQYIMQGNYSKQLGASIPYLQKCESLVKRWLIFSYWNWEIDWIAFKIKRIKSYQLWSRQLLRRKANLKSSSSVWRQLSCRSLSSQTWCRDFSAIQSSGLLQLPYRQNQAVKFLFRWKCPSKFAKTNSHRLRFCVSF